MEEKIQQQTLDTIQKQHKELLLSVETPGGVSTEQVNMFLHELALAGAVIEETVDRSLLSELLRYWSSIINDKTGKFPIVQLLPFSFRTQSLNRVNRWKVATLIQLIITVFLIIIMVLTFILIRSTSYGHTPALHPLVTPTTPLQPLESPYHEISVNIDISAFLSNDPNAINTFDQKVLSQSFLQNRRVGLVIVYGGAPDDLSIPAAQTVANKAYADLRQLAKKGPTFANAVYYNSLYFLGVPSSLLTIDMYLFTNS